MKYALRFIVCTLIEHKRPSLMAIKLVLKLCFLNVPYLFRRLTAVFRFVIVKLLCSFDHNNNLLFYFPATWRVTKSALKLLSYWWGTAPVFTLRTRRRRPPSRWPGAAWAPCSSAWLKDEASPQPYSSYYTVRISLPSQRCNNR